MFFCISDAAQPYFYNFKLKISEPNLFWVILSLFVLGNCPTVSDFFGDFGHSYDLYAVSRRNHMVGSLSLAVKIYAVSETFLYEYLLLFIIVHIEGRN